MDHGTNNTATKCKEKYSGLESPVSVYRQEKVITGVICEKIQVKDFKAQHLQCSNTDSNVLLAQNKYGGIDELDNDTILDEQMIHDNKYDRFLVCLDRPDVVSAEFYHGDSTDSADLKTTVPYERISYLLEDAIDLRLKSCDAAQLKAILEIVYDNLGIMLGFTLDEIEYIIKDKGRILPPEIEMLIKWTQKKTIKATFKKLLNKLRELATHYDTCIDWKKITLIVEENLLEKQLEDLNRLKPETSIDGKMTEYITSNKQSHSAGAAFMMIVYSETLRTDILVDQTISGENFKKTHISQSLPTNTFDVLLDKHMEGYEFLQDNDVLAVKVQSWERILILPKRKVDAVIRHDLCFLLESSSLDKFYSWVYKLTEDTKKRKFTHKDAVKVGPYLKKIMPQFMLMLRIEKGELEIAHYNFKQLSGPSLTFETYLLIKWTEKYQQEATVLTLLKALIKMEKANPGLIIWERLSEIFVKSSDQPGKI